MPITPITPPLAIVGGGNMALAIVRAAIETGVVAPERLVVADRNQSKRESFRQLGAEVVGSASEAVAWLTQFEVSAGAQPVSRADSGAGAAVGQILLAVKPQSLDDIGRELVAPLRLGGKRRVVMSILAGASSTRVRAVLGDSDLAVLRVMPNVAVQIRRGATALALGAGAVEGDEEAAITIFSALGRVLRIEEEMMNAFTAVAGSGPAYLFYLAEAMMGAAMEVGFDRETSQQLAQWTLTGAAALLDATEQPPTTLRAAVTSRGGTTEAAIRVLDEAKVMEIFSRAIRAGRDRGNELGA